MIKDNITFRENLELGDELSTDLMFLNGKAVLHTIDTASRFSAATFSDAHGAHFKHSVQDICFSFVMVWCLTYTGYPNSLWIDQRSVFTPSRQKHLTNLNGAQLRISDVEAHSSLKTEEKYHGLLKRIYRKNKFTHPTVSSTHLLKIAVRAMNDTVKENGLVPSRLVFGVLPWFSVLN